MNRSSITARELIPDEASEEITWGAPLVDDTEGPVQSDQWLLVDTRWALGATASGWPPVTASTHLSTHEIPWPDNAILPGTALTPDTFQRQRHLEQLEWLVQRFALSGLSWTGRDWSRITLDARDAALAFLRNLGSNTELPQVAPDGEGNLIFAWEEDEGPLIVILDGPHIHMVTRAATPQSVHHTNIPFEAEGIPAAVLSEIPSS